jgi:hypothetical protein
MGRVVVALGGNSLIRRGEPGSMSLGRAASGVLDGTFAAGSMGPNAIPPWWSGRDVI